MAQGTIYPGVIKSGGGKTLPAHMRLKLVGR